MARTGGFRQELLGLGFMATPRTFSQQFLFTWYWPSLHRPEAPLCRRVEHARLAATAPAVALLPKELGVVNLGDNVGGGEPEVSSKRVALRHSCKQRQPRAQLAKVLAGLELCRGER